MQLPTSVSAAFSGGHFGWSPPAGVGERGVAPG